MKLSFLFIILVVIGLGGFAQSTRSTSSSLSLAERFSNPPHEARPWVYFWWMDHMSKESITLEMEALKSKGIGGVILFQCDGWLLPKDIFGIPKIFWTPEWEEMVKFTIKEATRLGIDFHINYVGTSAGCGGPWISAEESGQTVVWSADWVKGGRKVEVKLPQPEIRDDVYHDVAVVAYPCEKPWDVMRSAAPDIVPSTVQSVYSHTVEYVSDGDADSYWASGINTEGGEYLDLTFKEDFTTTGVAFMPRKGWSPKIIDIQTSTDGKTYKSVDKKSITFRDLVSYNFSPITAQYFRVVFPETQSKDNRVGLCEFRLMTKGENPEDMITPIKKFAEKTASMRHTKEGLLSQMNDGEIKTQKDYSNTKSARVIDLTEKVDANGVLRWDAPKGNWIVMRFGRTSIGLHVRIQHNKENGYHVDYLNPESITKHYTHGIDPFLKHIGFQKGSALKGMHEDSFEMPYNRWTNNFIEEFQKRRGYDMMPWLPVLAGRIVDSKGASERFLWDYRRTIADLYLTHWEVSQKLSHERGLIFDAEAAGPQTYCFDALTQLSHTDIPMGEFWSGIYRPGVEVDDQHRGSWNSDVVETIKQTSSAAHIYGKNIVAAEAFTGFARPFTLDPFDIKAYGDRALCEGLNRFVIHLYMTQPMEKYNGKPVLVRLHAFDYNRRATWFDKSDFWTNYLARTSAMLQAGKPVADVAYYLGEGAPGFLPQREYLQPRVPVGYDYDACNKEVLLSAKVENGRIVLASGANYALLTLHPSTQSITPEVITHLSKLVKAGASILGPKPQYSPSLANHENADALVKKLSDEMWGTTMHKSGENKYGKGKVIWGKSVNDALEMVNCAPAFLAHGGDDIMFVQRTTDEGDIFFISQQAKEKVNFIASFRALKPVAPELWDPTTGKRQTVEVFDQKDGRINIPLTLDERGSTFIILKKKSPKQHFTSVATNGKTATESKDFKLIRDDNQLKFIAYAKGDYTIKSSDGTSKNITFSSSPEELDLSENWEVTFEGLNKQITFEKLISWTELEPNELRYYSGTATYQREFTWSPTSGNVEIDLGAVKNFAEVYLNGKKLEFLWKPPYKLDITSTVKPGINKLEIKVINLLHNRVSGDFIVPEDERHFRSFGAINQYRRGFETGQDPLLPAGLFGPVVIRNTNEIVIESTKE